MTIMQSKPVTNERQSTRSILYRRRGALVSLALLLVITEVPAQTSLPDLGDSSTAALSPTDEKKLGRRFMRQVRNHLPLVEDSDLNEYLRQLGNRLANAAAIDPDSLTFFLIDDSTLNAFAAPGGYIGVHTGLFLAASDESELAAVLSHELAHISQRHLARLIARSKELSFPAMAAVLAGVLIGGQAGVAAMTATNAAVSADSLSYSRNFEREADAIGIRTLNDAGFDPAGMTRFFGRMQRWARVQEINVPEFLRTHPLTLNRIAEAESRVAGLAPKTTDNTESNFEYIRTSIRARYSKRASQTVEEFRAELAEVDESDSESRSEVLKFGLALALNRTSDFDAARKLLNELIAASTAPRKIDFQLALAKVDLRDGEVEAALTMLEKLVDQNSDDVAIAEKYAETLIVAAEPGRATQFLEQLVRRHPQRAVLHKLLARAAAESNRPLIAHTALADYHYSRDELSLALDQLYAAREFSDEDYYQSARIEARIEQYETERLQYKD